jgi:hypothetical protein
MIKLTFYSNIIILLFLTFFITCQETINPNQNEYNGQQILSPQELSVFRPSDTISFSLLTDTLQPLQVLNIIKKNDTNIYGGLTIAHIAFFTQLVYGDTVSTQIISSKDTLGDKKVIKLNWVIPDSLNGTYEFCYHHFAFDSTKTAKLKLRISNLL